VVRAWEDGNYEIDAWLRPSTVASGLRVPNPFAGKEILKAIRGSSGEAVAVSDREIMISMKALYSLEGILPCPEGAATVAGVRRLREDGRLDASESVVIVNTGSGLKYQRVLHQLGSSNDLS
jgi:threonine synthase